MSLNFTALASYAAVAFPSSSGGSSFPTECWALDLNNDGRDDFVSFTPWTLEKYRPLNILLSTDSGFVESSWNTDPANSMAMPRNMKSADFNGDGLLDMAFFMAGNNEVSSDQTEANQIYISRGDGTFDVFKHEFVYHGGQGSSHGGAVADIDGDGDIDIIPTQYGPPYYWLENTSEAGAFSMRERTDGFMRITESSNRDEPANYRFADLDNDGIQDFMVGWGSWSYMDERSELSLYFGSQGAEYQYGDTTTLELYSGLEYLGTESDALFAKHGVRTYGQVISVVEVHDYDNDGDLDIFAGSNITPMDTPDGQGWDGMQLDGYEMMIWRNSYIDVFENLGDRQFKKVSSEVIPNQQALTSIDYQAGFPKDLYFVDLNGDGEKDILLRAEAGSEWSNWSAPDELKYPFVFLRDGDVFLPISKEEARPLWGQAAEQLVAGDFNGDGVSDVLGRTVLDPEYGRGDNGEPLGQPSQYEFVQYINQNAPVVGWEKPRYQGTQLDNTLTGTSASEYFVPGLGSDRVTGGEGFDEAFYWTTKNAFTFSWNRTLNQLEVLYADDKDVIQGVERLHFTSSSVALDLDGAAGLTAKILGAVFGADSVTNKEYAGIGLSLLDEGMAYEALAGLAIGVTGKASHTEICNLLWENVVGVPAESTDIAPYVQMLDNKEISVSQLVVLAADTTLNVQNIDLVGLAETGLEYTPVG